MRQAHKSSSKFSSSHELHPKPTVQIHEQSQRLADMAADFVIASIALS